MTEQKKQFDLLDDDLSDIENSKHPEQLAQPAGTAYVLPLRDVVIFPQMITTVLVGRKNSLNGVVESKRLNVPILAVTQTSTDHEEFNQQNIYATGTLCNIIDSVKIADGTLKVIIQGVARARIKNIIASDNFFTCEVEVLADEQFDPQNKEVLGLIKGCAEGFAKYAEYNKRVTPEVLAAITKIRSPYDLVYLILTYLPISIANKQQVLEENSLVQKLYKIFEFIQIEIEIAKTEARISRTVQEKITKNQKDYYLSEQLKHIKKELGQDEDTEFKELREKIAKLKLPKEAQDKCNSELAKLEKMNPYSSESGVVRNYLDWIAELPWHNETEPNNDLEKAKKLLDKNHYALKKIKERVLEFIAVQIKTHALKGPILCLVGPPGVGKTSLAKSIADALNRKYIKISLGGVRDESEIRGHRRTYIGSMPGRVIQSMKKAKTINPLMLLDEIDKMSHDFRGDPSSALLEVLDPEQNATFSDHYLELDYNLSKVMFIATANNVGSIPIPLRDRMEIIKLSGYTESEKLEIAKAHLLSKQLKENGLSEKEFSIDDEAILKLIRKYTFEAGVRNLNREIANLARKAAKEIVLKHTESLHITAKNLGKYAGVEKFHHGVIKEKDVIGVATGLAYTDFGGDLLDIEVLKFDGSGKIQTTGKLGDVMKESAHAALSYSRSIAKGLKIDHKKFNNYDFHIHVPEGATPKDGPSAGVALCVALISSLSDTPIRRDVAMTGEITLTGKVLEIGGLKEKLLAALRGGIKCVIIPKDNEKDLEDLPKEVTDHLKIKPVSHVDEALKICLVHKEKAERKNVKEKKSKN